MYLFYIDESGNLGAQSAMQKASGKKDVFALAAAGMLDHNWKKFNGAIRKKKRELYEKSAQRHADSIEIKDYEVKSNWLRRPQGREKSVFLNALSDEGCGELMSVYYEQLADRKMAVIGVVIDKQKLPEHLREPVEIHRKAWELLCERIENLMRERHSRHKAVIVADNCGAKANYRLAAQHARFLRTRTSAKVYFNHIIETPMFIPSELSEGIQLADMLAYNIYRAFSDGNIDYEYYRKITPYFYRSDNTAADKVDGLKIFPSADLE